MMFPRAAVFITLLAFVAACGGGESGNQQQQNSEGASGEVRTINIVGLDGMRFAVEEVGDRISVSDTLGQNQELRRLETISVKPGEEIRIRLTTQSELPETAMAHNWVLLTMDADVQAFATAAIQARENDYIPDDRSDEVIAQTGLAAGGETTTVTFTAPDTPGEYEYICTFPGHFVAGMRGTLVVEG